MKQKLERAESVRNGLEIFLGESLPSRAHHCYTTFFLLAQVMALMQKKWHSNGWFRDGARTERESPPKQS